jgi:SAM-dependent methyltransferase
VSREQGTASAAPRSLGETRSGARNLPGFLCSLLEPGPGGVLVLGASEVALEAAARYDVTVVEWNPAYVAALDEAARERGRRLRLTQRDPAREELGVPARSFRNVVCLGVLERFPDDVAVLEKLHRVLEPDGRLVVRVPARPWSRGGQGVEGARRYDAQTLRSALEEASFRPLRVRHWNLAGVPSAVRGRRAPEHAGHRWWDSPLDLWYGAVERRVAFPMGLSLVAVATPHLEKARVRRPAFDRAPRGHRQAYEPMAASR